MLIEVLKPFDIHSDKWSTYVESVEQYILVHKIKQTQKLSTLIKFSGQHTYKLMCDLCDPVKPESKTFSQLTKIVKDYLEPQRSIYAEREVFRGCKQKEEESIADFLKRLKHLAVPCRFGQSLEENICEQFVTGLLNVEIKSRLLSDVRLTFRNAVKLALSLEDVKKPTVSLSMRSNFDDEDTNGSRISDTEGSMSSKPSITPRRASTPRHSQCWRCGKPHQADTCRFKQKVCPRCLGTGHLREMCKSPCKPTMIQKKISSHLFMSMMG